MSWMASHNDQDLTRRIHVYRNGDQYFLGKTLVVNRRRVRNLDALLEIITEHIHAPQQVRELRTADDGLHIVRTLEELKEDQSYVAVSAGRFKQLPYSSLKEIQERKRTVWEQKRKEIQSNQTERLPLIEVSSKVFKTAEAKYIQVYVNGDAFTAARGIVISPKYHKNWSQVCYALDDLLKPSNGYVARLFTLDGEQVRNINHLVNGASYVAAGKHGAYKRLDYGKQKRFVSTLASSESTKQLVFSATSETRMDTVGARYQVNKSRLMREADGTDVMLTRQNRKKIRRQPLDLDMSYKAKSSDGRHQYPSMNAQSLMKSRSPDYRTNRTAPHEETTGIWSTESTHVLHSYTTLPPINNLTRTGPVEQHRELIGIYDEEVAEEEELGQEEEEQEQEQEQAVAKVIEEYKEEEKGGEEEEEHVVAKVIEEYEEEEKGGEEEEQVVAKVIEEYEEEEEEEDDDNDVNEEEETIKEEQVEVREEDKEEEKEERNENDLLTSSGEFLEQLEQGQQQLQLQGQLDNNQQQQLQQLKVERAARIIQRAFRAYKRLKAAVNKSNSDDAQHEIEQGRKTSNDQKDTSLNPAESQSFTLLVSSDREVQAIENNEKDKSVENEEQRTSEEQMFKDAEQTVVMNQYVDNTNEQEAEHRTNDKEHDAENISGVITVHETADLQEISSNDNLNDDTNDNNGDNKLNDDVNDNKYNNQKDDINENTFDNQHDDLNDDKGNDLNAKGDNEQHDNDDENDDNDNTHSLLHLQDKQQIQPRVEQQIEQQDLQQQILQEVEQQEIISVRVVTQQSGDQLLVRNDKTSEDNSLQTENRKEKEPPVEDVDKEIRSQETSVHVEILKEEKEEATSMNEQVNSRRHSAGSNEAYMKRFKTEPVLGSLLHINE